MIYYMAFGEICLRDTAGSPERARWLHLARSGSQSQRAVWFILPARGASHIIRQRTDRQAKPQMVSWHEHCSSLNRWIGTSSFELQTYFPVYH